MKTLLCSLASIVLLSAPAQAFQIFQRGAVRFDAFLNGDASNPSVRHVVLFEAYGESTFSDSRVTNVQGMTLWVNPPVPTFSQDFYTQNGPGTTGFDSVYMNPLINNLYTRPLSEAGLILEITKTTPTPFYLKLENEGATMTYNGQIWEGTINLLTSNAAPIGIPETGSSVAMLGCVLATGAFIRRRLLDC